MKKQRFINAASEALTIPGIGQIEPGEVVELPENFHNANFKRVPIRGMEPVKRPAKSRQNKKNKNKKQS